jgi:hypothetical protein
MSDSLMVWLGAKRERSCVSMMCLRAPIGDSAETLRPYHDRDRILALEHVLDLFSTVAQATGTSARSRQWVLSLLQ